MTNHKAWSIASRYRRAAKMLLRALDTCPERPEHMVWYARQLVEVADVDYTTLYLSVPDSTPLERVDNEH